jgi:hypothetical protein
MERAAGATAGGFATLAAHEVEGAWSQGPLGSHGAQQAAQGAIIAPESLAETGTVCFNLYPYIIYKTQIVKRENAQITKKRRLDALRGKAVETSSVFLSNMINTDRYDKNGPGTQKSMRIAGGENGKNPASACLPGKISPAYGVSRAFPHCLNRR